MRFKKIQKRFLFFLTTLWICFIFSFSLQNAEKSSALSSSVGEIIIENASPEISEKFDSMTAVELERFHALLRKCGHFTEFFILGLLVVLSLRKTMVIHKLGVAIGWSVIVAVIDEILQLFVDGRSGQLSDVLLDSCGAVFGMFFMSVMIRVLHRKQAPSVYSD